MGGVAEDLGSGFLDIVTVGGYSKARKEQDQAKKLAAEAKADQDKQLADIKEEEERAARDGKAKVAANAAAKSLASKNKTGRQSTILTDSLGGVGGEANTTKKSVLGL